MSDNNNQQQNKKTISIDQLIDSLSSEIDDGTNNVKNNEKMSRKLTLTQLHDRKRDSKFYLPVLNLNDKSSWESKPISERECFTDDVAKHTCLSNCNGHVGLQSSCCKLDPNDLEHVLGPISEQWIERTLKWFNKKGLPYTRHDIVIDFEEGKLLGEALFNDHPVFAKEDTYPILRIQTNGQRYACKFLNINNGKCTIYPIRPEMCKNYYCQYIVKNFLLKLKGDSRYVRYDKKLVDDEGTKNDKSADNDDD